MTIMVKYSEVSEQTKGAMHNVLLNKLPAAISIDTCTIAVMIQKPMTKIFILF